MRLTGLCIGYCDGFHPVFAGALVFIPLLYATDMDCVSESKISSRDMLLESGPRYAISRVNYKAQRTGGEKRRGRIGRAFRTPNGVLPPDDSPGGFLFALPGRTPHLEEKPYSIRFHFQKHECGAIFRWHLPLAPVTSPRLNAQNFASKL
jgi:hypothetical protein